MNSVFKYFRFFGMLCVVSIGAQGCSGLKMWDRGSVQTPNQTLAASQSTESVQASDKKDALSEKKPLQMVAIAAPTQSLDRSASKNDVKVDQSIDSVPDGFLSLKRDDLTVKKAIERWSAANGWQLVWQADVDFLIGTEIEYSSDIVNALATLFDHLAVNGPRLHAVMYSQNKVLMVKKLR